MTHMKCVAVCQTALVARNLHQALATNLELDLIVKDQATARRLHDVGVSALVADPRRVDSYLKADVGPTTCVIVEDDGRHGLRRILHAIVDAGATLVYVLSGTGRENPARADEWRKELPDVSTITLSGLLKTSLLTALGRSLTRARVQQYQRYFADADRVLILLHNDPDPDAMASGLALRSLLHRTKTTAIIGAFQGMTRPENLRMANLLDIKVEPITAESLAMFDRIATVDVQPHYFGGLITRVDLVVDHHPEQTGYTAAFKDVRPDYGSTSTILTEHLRSIDANISERTATAMLYAIKSDTLFLSRHTNQLDLEAFTFLYPLADAALVRKMEGAGITLERLEFVSRAVQSGEMRDQVYTTHLGNAPREDLIPYVADFLLQLDDVKWSIVSGLVEQDVIISVRNVGYSRNAGEFVKTNFADIGNAGGHRAMAKAVIPAGAFRRKYGSQDSQHVTRLLGHLATDFLADATAGDRNRGRSPISSRGEQRGERSPSSRQASSVRNQTQKS
jgi:nanoRNase/pAp phosphatase (c-di-AMP/oligoRNAs hydrolase)